MGTAQRGREEKKKKGGQEDEKGRWRMEENGVKIEEVMGRIMGGGRVMEGRREERTEWGDRERGKGETEEGRGGIDRGKEGEWME